jgi:hypothetical protein
MASLSERQCKFLSMIVELIQKSDRKDLKVIEWNRTVEQETKNIANGTSHLKRPEDCKHCIGLAVDLGVVDENTHQVIWERVEYERLGVIWESLGGRWGGRWATFNHGEGDYVHFEIDP